MEPESSLPCSQNPIINVINSMEQNPSPSQNFSTFYGTRNFITVLKKKHILLLLLLLLLLSVLLLLTWDIKIHTDTCYKQV
jgi:hypothetical protein